MFQTSVRSTPAALVTEVQRAFSFTDEHLATRFDVPVATIQNWRLGTEIPSLMTMKRLKELLLLNKALGNARSGKYRWA